MPGEGGRFPCDCFVFIFSLAEKYKIGVIRKLV